MTTFAPDFEQTTGTPVGDWLPARYTPSLSGSEVFPSRGDRLLTFAECEWCIPDAETFELDAWQRWLIRHILEVYPEDWPVEHLRGQMRFRQVVVSMGRQNGKSVIGALLAFYFLTMHKRGPRVVGLASVDRQAKIVYDRVRHAIDSNPRLSRDLRTTGTRGITYRAPGAAGIYQTLPADADSVQGEPVTGALYDELHLGLIAIWDALVLGQSSHDNSMLVGITTAGDDGSDLLIRLYAEGDAAIKSCDLVLQLVADNAEPDLIEEADPQFGFFVWEAADDELTEANVIRANPAIACGRKPLRRAMRDARTMMLDLEKDEDGLTGPQRVLKYTLNRFAEGAADSWTNTDAWKATARPEIEHGPGTLHFGIERTPEWEYAAITATSKAEGGGVKTELVAAINDPSMEQLYEACSALGRAHPGSVFAMPADSLNALADRLREDGREVWKLAAHEMAAAAQHAHGVIVRRAIEHADDIITRMQMARGRRKNSGDGWKISRDLSIGETDALLATVVGVFVATIKREKRMQLF